MKSLDYSRLVFRGAILMSACDGEIADSELTELESESSRSIIFEGLDTATEMKLVRADVDASIEDSVEAYLQELRNASLNTPQQMNLVRLLVRIASADSKIEMQERVFLLSLIEALQGSESGDDLGSFAGLVGPVFQSSSEKPVPIMIDEAAYTLPEDCGNFLSKPQARPNGSDKRTT